MQTYIFSSLIHFAKHPRRACGAVALWPDQHRVAPLRSQLAWYGVVHALEMEKALVVDAAHDVDCRVTCLASRCPRLWSNAESFANVTDSHVAQPGVSWGDAQPNWWCVMLIQVCGRCAAVGRHVRRRGGPGRPFPADFLAIQLSGATAERQQARQTGQPQAGPRAGRLHSGGRAGRRPVLGCVLCAVGEETADPVCCRGFSSFLRVVVRCRFQ
jgi:hypothetical protein